MTKSRDTQEVPTSIGREIALMMQIPKIKEDPKNVNDNDSVSSDEYFEAKKAKKELQVSLDKKENPNAVGKHLVSSSNIGSNLMAQKMAQSSTMLSG